MSLRRILATVAATAAVVVLPAGTASAADCVTPWNASSVYWGGNTASYNGHNWSAKWWTQNETPGTAQVWADQGACGGTTNPPSPSGFVVTEAQFNQMFPGRNAFYSCRTRRGGGATGPDFGYRPLLCD
jgi:chitodextrinase